MRYLTLLLAAAAGLARAETATVTVLATTDMHGTIYPVDYFTDHAAPRGLAKLATLIRGVRGEKPDALLVDCGDTIQGTPLEYVYQSVVRSGHGPLGVAITAAQLPHDPMMLAMNLLGYDAMAVGNHEFNFGLKNFNRARDDAKFPWLSANTVVAPGGKDRPFAPYIVKTVAGVKVAIIGITTPAVPMWEKPENIGAYRFLPPAEVVQRTVAELRAKVRPDLILVATHTGMGRDLKTNAPEEPAENATHEIATANPQLDAILFGHSHREVAGTRIGNVLVVQPKNWAISVARVDFTLERAEGGAWKVVDKQSRLLRATDETPAAADVLALAKPYHDAAQRYLSQPVATSSQELDGALGRVEDTALLDAVQRVQLFYTKADVSFTALFNPSMKLPRGPVTVRQIAALYPYDNELYLVEGTGQMVKDALENAARFYLSCQGERCSQPPLVNSRVMGFNYDIAEGVEYEVDLTHPEGARIRNLRWKGKPLAAGQPLKLAINNYRAAGSAGYTMFKDAKILWRSGEEIRDMIVRYYGEGKPLPTAPTDNWRVEPEAARRTLEKQARAAARRVETY